LLGTRATINAAHEDISCDDKNLGETSSPDDPGLMASYNPLLKDERGPRLAIDFKLNYLVVFS